MRAALGASRPRLALQAITESLLLSSAGAAAGILLAYLGTGVLTRIIAGGREPVELRVSPDARVLGFTIAVTIFSGLLFGLAPAWRAWRTAPASPLRDAGRAGDSALRRLFGRSLVVAQVALSVALLAGTGLFTGHLANLYAGLGFERDHVLIVTLDPSKTGYKRADLAGPYRDLLERLEAIPGVRSATLSGMTPISGAGANRDAKVEGYQPAPGELRYLPMNIVGPRYFETYGTPLEAGRDFRFSDQGGSRVAIVNRAFARHYYAGGNPIGKHVLFDGDDRPYEIVGMVGDAKYRDPGEAPGRTIYLNCFQDGKLYSHFSIRARGAPESVAAGVRRTVRETLPALRVEKVTTLAEQVNAAMVPERLIAMLSRWFGATAALLAAVGLYGLLAYSVARRTSEIGVRMALGATPGDVIRNVVGGAFALVIAGLLAGLPAALWGKRFAVALIPELRASIAASLALAVATLLAIAAVAAWAPARRAARVDPAEALRRE
jgi:predicted permease